MIPRQTGQLYALTQVLHRPDSCRARLNRETDWPKQQTSVKEATDSYKHGQASLLITAAQLVLRIAAARRTHIAQRHCSCNAETDAATSAAPHEASANKEVC